MRLIDADALKKAIEKYKPISVETGSFVDGENFMFDNCIREINNAPTVTRPQGEWLLLRTNYEDSGNNFYECTNCHYTDIHADSALVPFCWHCGAEMQNNKLFHMEHTTKKEEEE